MRILFLLARFIYWQDYTSNPFAQPPYREESGYLGRFQSLFNELCWALLE